MSSYSNAFLQLLYAVPSARAYALQAQAKPHFFTNPMSLWCELGFLFHMIETRARGLIRTTTRTRTRTSQGSDPKATRVADSDSDHTESGSDPEPELDPESDLLSWSGSKVVIPSNFQRTFQQLPEVAAFGLGLLDRTCSSSSNFNSSTSGASVEGGAGAGADPHQRTLNCVRFLLQRLHTEAEAGAKAPPTGPTRHKLVPSQTPIEAVFGYGMLTSTTYLQSGVEDKPVASLSLGLDLAYPSRHKGGASSESLLLPGTTSPSFSCALWLSFRRETRMRQSYLIALKKNLI
jgi:hypothetical protein